MRKIATFGPLLGLLLLASGQAGAQTDYSKVEMKTTDLGRRTYMIEGAGGNITVAVGDNGIVMVDSQFAPLHDKIKAAVAAVSKEPIRYLVNTHFHGDHTGGNEGFAKDGTVVTAHENVAKRLGAGTTNGLTGAQTPPAPQGACQNSLDKSLIVLVTDVTPEERLLGAQPTLNRLLPWPRRRGALLLRLMSSCFCRSAI